MAKNDFNVDDLVKADKHKADISGLEGRIKAIENRLGDNQKIASTFAEVAKKQIDMEKVFVDTFLRMLEKDESVKKALHKYIGNVDRDAVKAFWKKFGLTVWTGVVFLLGLLAKTGIDLLVK